MQVLLVVICSMAVVGCGPSIDKTKLEMSALCDTEARKKFPESVDRNEFVSVTTSTTTHYSMDDRRCYVRIRETVTPVSNGNTEFTETVYDGITKEFIVRAFWTSDTLRETREMRDRVDHYMARP